MKKTFKHFACLFMAILCFGQVWGTDYTFEASTFTEDNLSSTVNDQTFTFSLAHGGGGSNSYAGGQGGKYIKISAGKTETITFPEGFVASNINIKGYTNKNDASNGELSEVVGVSQSGKTFPSRNSGDISEYDFAIAPEATSVTFKTKGSTNQVCLLITITGTPAGGGATTTHTVTAVTSTGDDTHGTVSAASSTVAEGSTTVITAVPTDGYCVANWAVNGTGASITPSGSSNSKTTTLTMGTADATVTVTFEEITCPTSGTLYSAAVKSTVSSAQSFAANSTTEVSSSLADITGGNLYAINGESSAKELIANSSGYKFCMTNNTTMFKLELYCELEEGDVITIDGIGGTKNGDAKGLWVSSSESRPKSAPECSGTSTTESLVDDLVNYTVTSSDEYHGKTVLYIHRAVAASTYFNNITITRPATTYTVRLWNTTDWGETINAHVWNSDGNVTTWPGEATTFEAGWNTFEIEAGNSLLFCKADGTAQTVDITNVTADACYVLTGEADGAQHLELAADNECAARFYVAGNTGLTGENWNAAGSRLEDGSITFTNVPAGDHEFKITNGSWSWSRGAAAFDSNNSNVTNTGNDNVGFTTTEAKNITIAYDETTNKITVQAEDYEVPVESEYKAIVVAFGDKYYAMTTTLSNKGFTPLEVTVDDNGNVVVNSEAEKTSVLWKFNEGNNIASFQDANDKYLANKGTGTDLQLADEELTWTWNEAGYYEAVSGRTVFYNYKDNKFKNYSTDDLNKTDKSSGAPTFYDADKVVVSTTAKLKFFAPVAWETVKAYTWEGTSTGDHAMTAVEAGSRWFECDLEKGVPFLIYNGTWNGANQTANLAALEGDKCYAWTAATDEDGKIIATEIASCEMNYYIAGDEALTGVADWGHKALSNNSLTFNEVAAATYKFKITNGSWNWYLGGAYVDANACQNVTIENTDADGNVVFTIAAESNITITYNPATEKISVVASAATPKEYYTKVTGTEDITAGTYLIVYESGNVAFNGGLTTLDAEGNTIAVTISEGKIEVSDEVDAAAFFLDPEIGTVKSASDKYIGVASYSIGLSQSDKIYIYKNAFSIDGDGNAVIAVDFDGNNMVLRYNTGSGQTRFRYYKGDKQAIQLYKKAEAAKANPELAFNPTAVEAIKGETFTAPALNNTHNVTIAYEASNSKATVVAETGQVTLVSTGEVTIYAVSAANDTYRESYAKYTISISEYTKVREELTTGYYYTMCLDKAVTHVRGASIWRVLSKAQNNKDIILEEVTGNLDAGRPYFFYATADKMEVVYTGAAVNGPVNDDDNNGLVGAFTQTLITESETNFILFNNVLYYVNSEAYVGANRAYLDMTKVPAYNAGNSAPGRRRVTMQTNGEQVATGMDEVNVSEMAVKMIIDGQLFILRGEKMYDATGRLVK